MTAYEPGEEIQLNVESKRKFFAKAMSWRDQQAYGNLEKAAKSDDEKTVETDKILDAVLTRLVRTDPPIELTKANLESIVDYRLIWELNAAVKYNLTHDDKKKLD